MKAVKNSILDDGKAKLAFKSNNGWKYLDARRKATPFTKAGDVITFLEEVADKHDPAGIDDMIPSLKEMFTKSIIRING